MSSFLGKDEFRQKGVSETSYTSVSYTGKVISIEDPFDANRIQVRIKGIDDNIKDIDLPWCVPMMTLFFYNLPQVGEACKIYLSNLAKKQSKREWLGPIINQYQNLKKQDYLINSASQPFGTTDLDKGVRSLPEAEGLFPDKKDIALLGRDNVDIILKSKSLLLRAGKHEVRNNLKKNLKNPAYINLKISDDGITSTVLTVADEILLITHDGTPNYSTEIKEADLDKIRQTAHPLVFGDNLITFLKLIQEFVVSHVHPMDLPPNKGTGKIVEISSFDLNSLTSKKIKIN